MLLKLEAEPTSSLALREQRWHITPKMMHMKIQKGNICIKNDEERVKKSKIIKTQCLCRKNIQLFKGRDREIYTEA